MDAKTLGNYLLSLQDQADMTWRNEVRVKIGDNEYKLEDYLEAKMPSDDPEKWYYLLKASKPIVENLPIWKKSEPEPGRVYIIKFRLGSIVQTDDYRPKDHKFYYEDGDHYPDIELSDPSLYGWMYKDELDNLPREND